MKRGELLIGESARRRRSGHFLPAGACQSIQAPTLSRLQRGTTAIIAAVCFHAFSGNALSLMTLELTLNLQMRTQLAACASGVAALEHLVLALRALISDAYISSARLSIDFILGVLLCICRQRSPSWVVRKSAKDSGQCSMFYIACITAEKVAFRDGKQTKVEFNFLFVSP